MATLNRWLFEVPFNSETAYSQELEYEDEINGFNEDEGEQLETDLKYWNAAISNYLNEDGSPFPEAYKWPKETIFKAPPSETIKTGSYKTAVCPALDDFINLSNLIRDLKSQLTTMPKQPKGLKDKQAIKRWEESIRDWKKNIKNWEKEIDFLIRKMIQRIRDKTYLKHGCTKLSLKNLAKKVESLRGPWTRSGTMLDVRRATDGRLRTLRDVAAGAAK